MGYEANKIMRRVIPPRLLDSHKSLESIGFTGYAWCSKEVITVLDILLNNRVPILGGDVISNVGGTLKSTFDSWSINPDDFSSLEDFLIVSHQKTKEYINAYIQRNGDDFIFSIVIYALPIGRSANHSA